MSFITWMNLTMTYLQYHLRLLLIEGDSWIPDLICGPSCSETNSTHGLNWPYWFLPLASILKNCDRWIWDSFTIKSTEMKYSAWIWHSEWTVPKNRCEHKEKLTTLVLETKYFDDKFDILLPYHMAYMAVMLKQKCFDLNITGIIIFVVRVKCR